MLVQILVSMVVTDLAATESGFEQAVRVTFVQSTQTDTRTLQTFSGNPGYLKGFPVLVRAGWHACAACFCLWAITFSSALTIYTSRNPQTCLAGWGAEELEHSEPGWRH